MLSRKDIASQITATSLKAITCIVVEFSMDRSEAGLSSVSVTQHQTLQ